MFEKVVTAVEPFGLTMVVIAGLILADRIQIADRGIVGYVTVFVGAALIIVHIVRQIKTNNIEPKEQTIKKEK